MFAEFILEYVILNLLAVLYALSGFAAILYVVESIISVIKKIGGDFK